MYDLLIVDDEEIVRNGMKSTFNWSDYGFQVVDTADNGRTALEIVKAKHPHVVFTDIVMPEMDGLEFTEQVKQLYPEVNVVLLSAHKDFKYAHKAIGFGVIGYLLKPIDETELEKVLALLRSRLSQSANKDVENDRLPEFDSTEKKDNNYIRKAKQYVWDHYEKKIALDEVSRLLFITPNYFGYIFKRETGQNFIDYVILVKIEKAKKLLRNSDYKIKDISQKIGYEDYSYFCRTFKKIVGCTPHEYRSIHFTSRGR